NTRAATELLDDHRALEPPDPIPNSEVKRCIADGSVGLPHVRVGHRQALNKNPDLDTGRGFFFSVSPCPGVNTCHLSTGPARVRRGFIARLPCRPPADLVSLAGVRSAVSLLGELADCPAWLCVCRIADIFPFINTPASAIMRSPLLMIESHACSIVEDDVRRTVPLRRGARQGAGCQSRCGMEDAQTARG